MESNLLKKINFKGIKANFVQIDLTNDLEQNFGFTMKSILKDYCNKASNQNQIPLTEFFLKNVETLFRGKGSVKERTISKFISTLTLHKISPEIKFYYELFYNNITFRVSKIILAFLNHISEITPYKPKNYKSVLLKNVKLEIKEAIELCSKLVRDENSVENFTHTISSHFQNTKNHVYKISCDKIGRYILETLIMRENQEEILSD